ncbi:hypothetical protein HK098_001769 [Nowakowskiella sp. JEL0407]|nr:hypothetical protein HK098_001769 [Nowakowskiella sp. JEL0407]
MGNQNSVLFEKPLTSTFLPIIDEKYCSTETSNFMITDESSIFDSESYTVFDGPGNLKYRAEKKPFSFVGRKSIFTETGEILCSFERIPLLCPTTWKVFLDSSQRFCTIKEGKFYRNYSLVVTIPANNIPTPVSTKIADEKPHQKPGFDDSKSTSSSSTDLTLKLISRSCETHAKIFLGEEMEVAIGEIYRVSGGYHLTVVAGVDTAFMMMFCVILEELHRIREARRRSSNGGGGGP